MNKNIEIIQNNIKKVLNNEGKDCKNKSIEELLEEINIYYQELEYQNDELTRVRRDLEESKQKYQDLFDNAPIQYVTYNNEYIIQNTNNSFKKIFLQDDSIPHKITEIIDPDSQDNFYFHINRLQNEKKNIQSKIYLLKNNLKTPVKIQSNILFESNKLLFKTAIIDLSKEEEYQKTLVEAQRKAEMASEAKSQFLAHMSHEIRTPLNGIIGFSEILEETQLSAPQLTYVDYIKKSGKLLLDIVNDILDFSKIEANKLELEIIPSNISEIIRETISMVSPQAIKKNIDLTYEIPNSIPTIVNIDPIRIRQVLLNLIGNSIKFTEKGYVKLTLKLDDNKLYFYIEDSGIGIKEEEISKLFSAFSQADSSTTRKFGGTGLGLAISNSLAKKMGSQISINSTYGKGSVFYFWADISKESTFSPQKYREANKIKLDNSSIILIVEDNLTNIELMAYIVERTLPYGKILRAQNGLEALLICENIIPDIIFMDVNMPILDGLESTRKIRAIEKNLLMNTPIISLTAGVLKNEVQECLSSGMTDILTKPIVTVNVIDLLNKYLALPTQKIFDSMDYLSRVLSNKELGKKIIAKYIDNSYLELNELNEALYNDDYKNIKDIIHRWKGSSSNVSANRLTSYLIKIENSLELKNKNGIILTLQYLLFSYKKFTSEFNWTD